MSKKTTAKKITDREQYLYDKVKKLSKEFDARNKEVKALMKKFKQSGDLSARDHAKVQRLFKENNAASSALVKVLNQLRRVTS